MSELGRVQRLTAVESVLQRLPGDAFNILDELGAIGALLWLVFPAGQLGNVRTKAISDETPAVLVTIYLDASLESPLCDPALVRGVVAHELAHIVLSHDGLTPSGPIEQMAWQMVIEWGLELEAAKALALAGCDLAAFRLPRVEV